MKHPVDDSELVTVAQMTDPTQAQMAQSALEAAGIEVFLQGENATNLYPGSLLTSLLVKPEDEASALELLNSDGGKEATDQERETEQ